MHYPSITLRAATAHDAPALARLAELDEDRPLSGEVLLAETDDGIVAALSVREDRAVADIFKPTADLVAMLRARRAALLGARRFSHAGSAERSRGARRLIARLRAQAPA